MNRLFGGLVIAVLVLSSCAGEETEAQTLRAILARAQEGTVQFVYVEQTKDRKAEVRARLEDTLRHEEILLINDQKVLERVVRDDVLAIHVFTPGLVPQVSNVTAPQDLAAAAALVADQWVIDPAGAPRLSAGDADTSRTQVGADPIKDAVNTMQYLSVAITEAAGVNLFNPDAVDYQPKEDPFPHPNAATGERRYDLVRPPLPQREGNFPTAAHFRKMSFYVIKDRLVRVLEQIDISAHEDFKRARQTGRNEFLSRLEAQLKAGSGPVRIRERRMSFEILSTGEPLTVDLPGEGVIGNLRVLFQERSPEPS